MDPLSPRLSSLRLSIQPLHLATSREHMGLPQMDLPHDTHEDGGSSGMPTIIQDLFQELLFDIIL